MVRVAVDTNVLIRVCTENTVASWLASLVTDAGVEIVVNKRVREQFLSGASTAEMTAFTALSDMLVFDEAQFFTIGQSTIGGGDVIGGGPYAEFEPDYSEEKYLEYRLNAESPKNREMYVRRMQSDPAIVSHAIRFQCDYLVSNDLKLAKKAEKLGLSIKVITFDEFVRIFRKSSSDLIQ
jgi:rRNA-processing protein FCF1